MEPRVTARVEKLIGRFDASRITGEVVNVLFGFNSMIIDIISSVLFEEPSDFLSHPNFNEEWFKFLAKRTISVGLFKRIPFYNYLMGAPIVRMLLEHATDWRVWDDKARRQMQLSKLRSSVEAKTRSNTTVLDHLVHGDLEETEIGHGFFKRLAQLIQQAGSYNVAFTLSTIVTFLLLDETKEDRLREEIRTFYEEHDGTCPSWRELEKAPYLSACIKEGLRLGAGSMNRAPRVAPVDDLHFDGWVIPKDTPVAMSSYWIHRDPVVFPDPDSFLPDRWMVDAEALKPMLKQYVPFAKGSRNCVGQNLVYMIIYLTLARMFGPGLTRMELFESGEDDITPVFGYLFPLPRLESKGTRVRFLGGGGGEGGEKGAEKGGEGVGDGNGEKGGEKGEKDGEEGLGAWNGNEEDEVMA